MLKRKFKLVQKVPKTPKSAYNHGRFISSLLEHQIKHFHEVEKYLAKTEEQVTDISKIKTELEASKYLQMMTIRLHPQGAEKPKKVVERKRTRRVTKRKPKQLKRKSQ